MIDDPELRREAATCLKHRVQSKINSNRLAVLVSIITLLGMAVLLFTGFGYLATSAGILASAAFISMFRFFVDRHADNILNEKIKLLANGTLPPSQV